MSSQESLNVSPVIGFAGGNAYCATLSVEINQNPFNQVTLDEFINNFPNKRGDVISVIPSSIVTRANGFTWAYEGELGEQLRASFLGSLVKQLLNQYDLDTEKKIKREMEITRGEYKLPDVYSNLTQEERDFIADQINQAI